MGCTPAAVRRRRRIGRRPKRLSSWLKTRAGRALAGGMTCWRRSPQAAWNAGMASGFFCVAGARHLELGAEARADDGVERLVLDLHPMGLAHPLPQRLIRGETFGPAEGLLQAGEHSRCEGDRFASRDVG